MDEPCCGSTDLADGSVRGIAPGIGLAQLMQGDLVSAVAQFREIVAECEAAHDSFLKIACLHSLGIALAYQGDVSAARAVADAALTVGAELGEYFLAYGESVSAVVPVAVGDLESARDASEAAWQHFSLARPQLAAVHRGVTATEAALAGGDLVTARRWADDAVAVAGDGI